MLKRNISRFLYSVRDDITYLRGGCKKNWSKDRLITNLEIGYQNDQGRPLRIAKPELFTEKLQWYKVNYRHPDMSRIVDKYDFKDYIKQKLGEGYTIPAYGVWDSVKALEKDWDSLPEEFCLKSTVQSDGRFIKLIHKKSEIDFREFKKELKKWFNERFTLINSYCGAYYGCKPRILAEQYMKQVGDQLYDYKIFCFSGVPHCVYVATNHFETEDYPITFYDLEWNRMDVKYGKHLNEEQDKPYHFKEMIEISKILSKEFPFVRVDFFDTKDKLLMAELTFYPGGGNTPYDPISFDKELGDLFIFPQVNE